MDSLKEQLNTNVDELTNKVGEFIRYWGFKNIHGKIWCYIFLSGEPLDASQLIEKTGVSKALMSQSLSELLDYKVILILDEHKKKKRYITNKKILSVITSVLRQREQVLLGDVARHHKAIENYNDEQLDLAGVDRKQVVKLGKMIAFAEKFLYSMLRFESICFSKFKKIFE
ncbi:MAG: hypothetical protein NXH75_03485 [Halobacteriovoraceae bacterium]|nr:hypothetical protein [Halobacteriovoraceae bacterium]